MGGPGERRGSLAGAFARRAAAAVAVYALALACVRHRLLRWMLLALPGYLLLLYAAYALVRVGRDIYRIGHPPGERESLLREVEEAVRFLKQNDLFPTQPSVDANAH